MRNTISLTKYPALALLFLGFIVPIRAATLVWTNTAGDAVSGPLHSASRSDTQILWRLSSESRAFRQLQFMRAPPARRVRNR